MWRKSVDTAVLVTCSIPVFITKGFEHSRSQKASLEKKEELKKNVEDAMCVQAQVCMKRDSWSGSFKKFRLFLSGKINCQPM